MSQELTDADNVRWLKKLILNLEFMSTAVFDKHDVERFRSIAARLERPAVEVDAWLKFEGPGNWHLETSVATAEVQRIFGCFPDVAQNRVRITIHPV